MSLGGNDDGSYKRQDGVAGNSPSIKPSVVPFGLLLSGYDGLSNQKLAIGLDLGERDRDHCICIEIEIN